MRYSRLLIGLLVLILSALPLAGCTSKAKHEALQASYETLQAEHAALVLENTSLKTELESVQPELTKIQDDYDALQSDYEALQTDYTTLDTGHKAVQQELAQIREVYPPRYFSSVTELQNWLAGDDISDRASDDAVLVYQSALELQKRALQDGYIINANITTTGTTPAYYTIYCSAVTEEDSLYTWVPETDDVNQ